MEKARAAVREFTGRHGHTTDVTEEVAPAVTSEHIKPTRHEEVQEAIDREVHQDHYHTTVQPIQHQEVLPEQHQHVMKDVTHKEFHHGNEHETRQRLEHEAARFKNTTHTHETKHTTAAAPVVEGEHVHHHVHELVQPVIHKETITPEVVHTTVPIHEHHHASAQHHGVSHLPMKTLSEFETAGGLLKGGKTSSHETYEGAPRPYNRELMKDPTDADLNHGKTGLSGPGSHHTGGTELSGTGRSGGLSGTNTSSTTAGPHSSNIANKADLRVDSDLDGNRHLGHNTGAYDQNTSSTTGAGSHLGRNTGAYDQNDSSTTGAGSHLGRNTGAYDQNASSTTGTGSHLGRNTGYEGESTTSTHKPSMMDRLNPMKKT